MPKLLDIVDAHLKMLQMNGAKSLSPSVNQIMIKLEDQKSIMEKVDRKRVKTLVE